VSRIFVSYRRQDTQSATGRLCDKLQAHFGADQVFHDIESIEAGADFGATIATTIAASSVVLVMIGRHWIDARSDDGRSRLFDPNDYVRLEIAIALEHGVPVIPVLVEGAAMPSASALPEPISALAARQAHEITEQRWQYDSDVLVKQIERFVPPEGGTLTAEGASTPGRALRRAVVSWPVDFAQLLVRPRRWLAALHTQPDALARSAVFFTISQLVAAWLFVLPDFVASVPMFVLDGVPMGLFILLLVLVPLHLAARLVRVPSHAPSTMMVLAYIESVAIVLVAVGVTLMWTAFGLSDPEFGQKIRVIFGTNLPLEARMARMAGLVEAGIGGPFLAAFALTNLIWLYAAGWIVVASQALRDMWRISRLRFAAILILVALVISIAGALVTFAGTL
jgi:hypothetical protein